MALAAPGRQGPRGSTDDETRARDRAQAEAPEGTAVLADRLAS